MSNDALAQAEKLIPAEVRMISGCRDEQVELIDSKWPFFLPIDKIVSHLWIFFPIVEDFCGWYVQ
jgi:hypothetical protein